MSNERLFEQSTLEAAKAGDRKALNEVLTIYRPFLQELSTREISPAVRRRIDTSDIVQLTLAEAYRCISQFQGTTGGEFEAWLRMVLRNAARQAGRSASAKKRNVNRDLPFSPADSSDASLDVIADQTSPSSCAIQNEEHRSALDGLEQLPRDQRDVLRLRYFEQLSLRQIATQLDCKNEQAVSRLIQNALKTLRSSRSIGFWGNGPSTERRRMSDQR